MYDVGGKLLNNIKSIYVNSLVCVRVKEMDTSFKTGGVREVSFPLGFSVCIWLE